MDRKELEAIVRDVLAAQLMPKRTEGSALARPHDGHRTLVTERDVLAVRSRGEKQIVLVPRSIVTPLARETAGRFSIELRDDSTAGSPSEDHRVETPARIMLKAAAPDSELKSAAKPTLAATTVKAGTDTIALGCDHGGFALKTTLKTFLEGEGGYRVVDLGTFSPDPVDYADYAHLVAARVARGEVSRGVLVDGMGVGSCMAANRHRGVRAALGAGMMEVVNAREHNDANVLCLGSKTQSELSARALVMVFLTTAFGGGRHSRRVAKIDEVAS